MGSLALALAACGAAATPAPAGTAGPGATSGPAGSASTASSRPAATGTAGGPVDACRYATVAEVGAAYGFTATTAKSTADDNYAYCEYKGANDHVKILTYVSRSDTSLFIYDSYKKGLDKSVSGLGNEAFWADGVLYIKKGGIFAGIQLRSSGSGTVEWDDAGEALGKIIAGRL